MATRTERIKHTGAATYSYNELSKHFAGELPTLVIRALLAAIDCHDDQIRRYSKLPYMVHPVHVACLVKKHLPEASDELIASCLLHDVVEDTHLTFQDVQLRFGSEVAEIVDGVTKRSYDLSLSKLEVKRLEGIRIGRCRSECQTLKCADIVSNVSAMKVEDADRASSYIVECRAVYENLGEAAPVLKRLAAGELFEI